MMWCNAYTETYGVVIPTRKFIPKFIKIIMTLALIECDVSQVSFYLPREKKLIQSRLRIEYQMLHAK